MALSNILQVELVGGAGHVFLAGLLPGDGHLGGALRLGDRAVHFLIVYRFPAALLLALPGIKAKAAVGVKVGGEELEDPPVRETVQMGHLGKVDLGAQPQLASFFVGGDFAVPGDVGHPAQVAVGDAKGLLAELQIAGRPAALLLDPVHDLLAQPNFFHVCHINTSSFPNIKTPLSPQRDKGADLCGTTLLAKAECFDHSSLPNNGGVRRGLLEFSPQLQGDLRRSLPSAFHQTAALFASWERILVLFRAFLGYVACILSAFSRIVKRYLPF